MQHKKADDYVIATGKEHSVRQFCEKAFQAVDIDVEWKGNGINEKGINKKTKKVIVDVSNKFYRPTEVDILKGDASKAKRELGWEPEVSFDEMIKKMVKNDIKILEKDL